MFIKEYITEKRRHFDYFSNVEFHRWCEKSCEKEKDEVAKRERDKNESWKRAFHEPWKVNQDWLVYDVDKVAMFCMICSMYATTKNDRLLLSAE